MKYNKLPLSFYSGSDVLAIARALLGKVLVTRDAQGRRTSGTIVECEAYTGEKDKAAHVYGGKRTRRTETMYQEGGRAYIYFCYGIHHLINVVTNRKDIPHAVLLRALEPLEGVELMRERRKKTQLDETLTRGPGSLSQALGIRTEQDGALLTGNEIWIEDHHIQIADNQIECGPRIGVAYAQEDALLPYRYWLRGNRYVSKMPKEHRQLRQVRTDKR